MRTLYLGVHICELKTLTVPGEEKFRWKCSAGALEPPTYDFNAYPMQTLSEKAVLISVIKLLQHLLCCRIYKNYLINKQKDIKHMLGANGPISG